MSDSALPDRLAGAIWGHLVGDTVGVPYEFRTAADIGTVRFGATGTHHEHDPSLADAPGRLGMTILLGKHQPGGR